MLKLPEKNYSVVKEVFGILGFSEEKQRDEVERFEQELTLDFAEAAVKKLPEQERAGVIKLANSKDDESKKQFNEKLKYWFNEKEYMALLEKTADNLFAGLLQFLYKSATQEQQKKLESVFKTDTLKDV